MNYRFLLFFCFFVTSHSAFSSASFAILQKDYNEILGLRNRVDGETLGFRQWNDTDWLNRAYCASIICMELEEKLGLPQHEDASIACSCRYELENRGAFDDQALSERTNEMFATFAEKNADICEQILLKMK
jgi:hypothetical protein